MIGEKTKQWVRLVFRWTFFAGALAGILYAILRTEPGHRAIASAVFHATHHHIRIEGLAGELPERGTLRALALHDDHGEWLVCSNVVWDLNLIEFLRRPHPINRVVVGGARVSRWPSYEKKASHKSTRPEVQVLHAVVDELHLDPIQLRGRVSGEIAMSEQGLFLLATGEETARNISFSGAARFAAPGTPPAASLVAQGAFPVISNFIATAYATHQDSGWHGSLDLKSSSFGHAQAGWHRNEQDHSWQVDAIGADVSGVWKDRNWKLRSARLNAQPSERRAHLTLAGEFDGVPLWADGPVARRPEGWHLPQWSVVANGLCVCMTASQRGVWSGKGRVTSSCDGALKQWTHGALDAAGRLNFTWENRSFSISARLPELQTPVGIFRDIVADVRKDDDAITFPLVTAQTWERSGATLLSAVQARGSARPVTAGWRLSLDDADAMIKTQSIHLANSATFEWADHTISWSTTRLAVAGAECVSSGIVGEYAKADLIWRDLPLSTLSAQNTLAVSGLMEGSIICRGLSSNPELTGKIRVRDLRPLNLNEALQIAPAELNVDAHLKDGHFSGETLFSGWSDEPLRAVLDGPVQLSIRPWTFAISKDQGWSGMLRASYDLARLEQVFDLRGAHLRGLLDGSLSMSGSLERPRVEGHLGMVNGEMDIPDSGASLRDINILLTGDAERLMIQRASATDGGTGRISAVGSCVFDPVRRFPLDLRIMLEKVELWRNGGNRIAADGELIATGTLNDALISGLIQLPNAVIQLGRRKSVTPTLPLAHESATEEKSAAGQRSSGWTDRVKLDIAMKSRGPASVSGRGLTSEWKVDLRAGGSIASPRISGSAQSLRGYFLFMGRRFDLESAWVGLDGRFPVRPTLNLIATSRASELVARLHASGPLEQPTLELTSDPSYPPDEIVARLLFGKSADSISPFQAIGLAHGLSVLRGQGTSLDVLDRGQSLLRVDQLDLRQDSEQGSISSVSVGKYIGRRIFLQGEAALDGSGEVIAMEVDLMPSLTLQTEASPGIREGIGLKWRHDY